MELTQYEILAIILGAFGTGFFKSTFSMGIGLVLVPFMLIFWPTRFVIGIISIHMLVSDYALIHLFWKQWEWRLAKLVIPGFYVGIISGTAILASLPDFWIRKFIGFICVVFIFSQGWSEFKGGLPTPRIGKSAGAIIGLIGGVVSALTHTGGTVLTLYLLSQGVKKVNLVATILITWLFVNPVKVSAYYAAGLLNNTLLIAGAASIPLAFSGGWIGRKLLDKMSQRFFNTTILALAAAAAIRLLWE
ncbi:MAG: sulfite exporter TauE/SafE family protein [Nitrospinaceae bacterium]|mgnify:CR=1 FL=1|nr:sulfite exporter TauE/SafE family protein [Nitrospinaceae bacterium]MBT3435743.1 sulfite exporter TauE/SafE family protein [Nitrospinaceae bacterium]MBT3822621.1 sulfite exporter TauE/SafE family protein [Nitrospinaceae bacterium]MBT4093237.1 sulfite exporter TauE/SafE family protein [Nitrospinaceae bacterium]MBT4431019.1 sulfite exporter TauE/SafE family protein [Nitrospinaceae bacterium]